MKNVDDINKYDRDSGTQIPILATPILSHLSA